MAFYDDMAATAADMLAEFGQAVTVKRSTGNAYNPATGENSAGTPVTFAANAAVFDYDNSEINGTVLASDKKLIMESGKVIPVIGDYIETNGAYYRAMAVNTLSPGSVDVIYTVQLRL